MADPEKQDATPKGADNEDLTEEEKQQLESQGREKAADVRLSALDQIAANVDRQRVEEDGMKLDIEEPAQEEPEGNETDQAGEETSGEHAIDEAEAAKKEKEQQELERYEEEVTLVIDGTEQKVPLSKVKEAGIRTLQKESAADKRLEEASRLKKQAEELLEEATKKAAEAPTKTDGSPDGKTPEERDAEFNEKKRAWIQAIQYGDEDEAAAAIDEIIAAGRGTTPAITPEMIQEEVQKALEQREEQAKEQAAEVIRQKFFQPAESGGFQDLGENPYLMAEVTRIVNEKLAAGEPNVWETYAAAGAEVRKAREEAVKPKPPPKPKVADMKEKEEKKKGIDEPKPVSAKQETTTPSDQEKTEEQARAEAVQEIMKVRGQTR